MRLHRPYKTQIRLHRPCKICGKRYQPTGSLSRICEKCKVKARKISFNKRMEKRNTAKEKKKENKKFPYKKLNKRKKK